MIGIDSAFCHVLIAMIVGSWPLPNISLRALLVAFILFNPLSLSSLLDASRDGTMYSNTLCLLAYASAEGGYVFSAFFSFFLYLGSSPVQWSATALPLLMMCLSSMTARVGGSCARMSQVGDSVKEMSKTSFWPSLVRYVIVDGTLLAVATGLGSALSQNSSLPPLFPESGGSSTTSDFFFTPLFFRPSINSIHASIDASSAGSYTAVGGPLPPWGGGEFSLYWYLASSNFLSFAPYFSRLAFAHPLVYILPICIRFRGRPTFAFALLFAISCLLDASASYSLYRLPIAAVLLLRHADYLARVQYGVASVAVLTLNIFAMPVLRDYWLLPPFAGNANLLMVQQLTFAVTGSLLLADVALSAIKCEEALEQQKKSKGLTA